MQVGSSGSSELTCFGRYLHLPLDPSETTSPRREALPVKLAGNLRVSGFFLFQSTPTIFELRKSKYYFFLVLALTIFIH